MLGIYSRQIQSLILKIYQMQPPSLTSRSLRWYRFNAQDFTGACRLHRRRGADELVLQRTHLGETLLMLHKKIFIG